MIKYPDKNNTASMITKIKNIILLTIAILTTVNPLISAEPEKLWGISKTELISRLKLENYSTFKPEDNPEYSNKIIDFFSTMNPDERAVITIIKSPGSPEIEYCFFNEKLYSISEEWGNVDRNKAHNILKALVDRYAEPLTDGKNLYTIYSFKKNKTKILVYKKAIDEKSVQIKVYFYSTDLFGMFLSE